MCQCCCPIIPARRQWPQDMLIPCRRCTDENGGAEIRKPLRNFAVASRLQDFWDNALARGQDLCCMRCQQIMRLAMQDAVIECDSCQNMLARSKFDAEYVLIWSQGVAQPVLCRVCKGNREKTLRRDLELIYCHGPLCQKSVPEINFEELKLAEWRIKDLMHDARCARCVVNGIEEIETCQEVECQRCKVKKQLRDFPAVALKEWLAGLRHQFRWRCFECQFPRCSGPCGEERVF